MHSAQGRFSLAERNTSLHEARIEFVHLELLLAPGASEEAALIGEELGTNLEYSRDSRFTKYHAGLFERTAGAGLLASLDF